MNGELCVTCGYWVATDGPQCDSCRHDPRPGLESAVIAAAIVWRRNRVPNTSTSTWPACAALGDAVDRLIKEHTP